MLVDGVTVNVAILALQLAVVPPLLPAHAQLHGPLPVIELAVPVVQKFAAGKFAKVPLLLAPQAPLTGVSGIRLKVAAIV